MATNQLDEFLQQWPYDASGLGVRLAEGSDGRPVIQMRVDMGVLQLEVDGRPDGTRPYGEDSMLDHLLRFEFDDSELTLDDDQCTEIDREFVQYYHRRVCWLKLQSYAEAVSDADHTLALMDFCKRHSDDEQWIMSHEQYRPFVLFHRTQAEALAALDRTGPEEAIEALNEGLERIHGLFIEHEISEHFEDDDLVQRLTEFRETLRDEYEVGRTLNEQLADAVAAEQYELAARLRDELARREGTH